MIQENKKMSIREMAEMQRKEEEEIKNRLIEIHEGLLKTSNISEAGRLFIEWNKEKNYETIYFNSLACTLSIHKDDLNETDWGKYYTISEDGLNYDDDYVYLAKDKQLVEEEFWDYCEYCKNR
ncbi:MAG: hypothetical protein ACPLVF_01955 [Thermovenabulum sp.]|uniref:hypothetical protein n=1 Tax=Thermovenabulum sp. TaxID=3100335 RepID=UPI003C7B7B74